VSAIVGYGVEIDNNILNEDTLWDELYENKDVNLEIKNSRAEYGDEQRYFLFIKSSIITAGERNNTVSPLTFPRLDSSELETFIKNHEGVISEPGWFLLDYYIYS
jgi:hypothetical protein